MAQDRLRFMGIILTNSPGINVKQTQYGDTTILETQSRVGIIMLPVHIVKITSCIAVWYYTQIYICKAWSFSLQAVKPTVCGPDVLIWTSEINSRSSLINLDNKIMLF